jgi:hypothetical protein
VNRRRVSLSFVIFSSVGSILDPLAASGQTIEGGRKNTLLLMFEARFTYAAQITVSVS